MNMNWKFPYELDHIGVACKSIDETKKLYMAMGFDEPSIEVVETEGVKVGFMQLGPEVEPGKGVSRIELLEPLSDNSPIAKFLLKRGPGIHHICLRVQDIQKAIETIKTTEVQLIDEKPKPGAHNCLVAFIHPKSTGGVLIELSQSQN